MKSFVRFDFGSYILCNITEEDDWVMRYLWLRQVEDKCSAIRLKLLTKRLVLPTFSWPSIILFWWCENHNWWRPVEFNIHVIWSVIWMSAPWKCRIWNSDRCVRPLALADSNAIVQRGKQRIGVPTPVSHVSSTAVIDQRWSHNFPMIPSLGSKYRNRDIVVSTWMRLTGSMTSLSSISTHPVIHSAEILAFSHVRATRRGFHSWKLRRTTLML